MDASIAYSKYRQKLHHWLAKRRKKLPHSFLNEILGTVDHDIIRKVKPHSLVSNEGLYSLLSSVEYLVKRGIPGAFIECGVARGGASFSMALKLLQLGVTDRDIYLYDTFEGTPKPGTEDTSSIDRPAIETWLEGQKTGVMLWGHGRIIEKPESIGSLDRVRKLMASAGYPMSRIHLVKGLVEDTIPKTMPSEIALLRLDTDFYSSTRHELHHLYPLLSPGGVLIVDDYGVWDGARKATDEYFATTAQPLLLHRTDRARRIAIKA